MNAELTAGVFSGLGQMFGRLIKMTPEQISASSAPDFLKIAAMERQARARQQPATPPTSTVAAQVVNQAVGAPEMPQGMPQGAQAGGYIHDYGVASLPYTPHYEHGGIVSFAEGGDPGEEPGLTKRVRDYIGENPGSAATDAVAAAAILASFLPYGKAVGTGLGVLNKGARWAGRQLWNNKGRATLAATLAARHLSPGEEPEAPDVIQEAPAAAQESAGMGIPSFAPPSGSAFTPMDVDKLGLEEESVAPYVSPLKELIAGGIDNEKHFGERQAAIDKRLGGAKQRYKDTFLGEGLMAFGAKMAAGKSANFLQNVAEAVPAYAETISKSGSKYEDYKDAVEDAKEALSDAKFAAKKGDVAAEIAAKQRYADRSEDAKNKLIGLQNAARAQNERNKFEAEQNALTRAASRDTAYIAAGAASRKAAYAALVKGAMNDSQLAEFSDANVKILPHIKKLTAQYEKDQNPETLAKLDDAVREALVVALSNSGTGDATLWRMGYDPKELRKQLKGRQASVTPIGKKAGGILSLAR